MTPFEQLQHHKGGLIRLKTQLYWYSNRGYDGSPGRICLLLDATSDTPEQAPFSATTETRRSPNCPAFPRAAVFLLIDDRPHWVWVSECDVEVLNETG